MILGGVGFDVGKILGCDVETPEGTNVGAVVGAVVGASEGIDEGTADATMVG